MAGDDQNHAARIFKPGMQSSVSNSKSRAYQRALAKNLESQRRLDTEYSCIDYVKHKARCEVNSQIYQLKAELYKIRAKTPSLDEFRRGKRVAGVENFSKEMATYNNDLYEVVNGKVTKTKQKTTGRPPPPSTLVELYPYGGRPQSRLSRPATGKSKSSVGKGSVSFAEHKKRGPGGDDGAGQTSLEARKQAAAELTPSSAEIGEKMDEILGLSSKEDENAQEKLKYGHTRKSPTGDSEEGREQKQLGHMLGLATKEDINSQKRRLYGLGAFEFADIDSDSDDSDDEFGSRRGGKPAGRGVISSTERPRAGGRGKWDDGGERRPRQPATATLESRSRRVRTRRVLVDTPRSPSPQMMQDAEKESSVDVEAILNPANTVSSGNPYQSLFRPQLVTVQRIARMSSISRRLRLVDYFREEEDYGKAKPTFVIIKEPAKPKKVCYSAGNIRQSSKLK